MSPQGRDRRGRPKGGGSGRGRQGEPARRQQPLPQPPPLAPAPAHGAGARPRRRDAGLGGDQVEGRQAVAELLRAGRRRVHQVLMAEGSADDGPGALIAGLAAERGVPVRVVTRGRIDATAGTEAPQGVVATADPVEPAALADLARRPTPSGGPPLLVVLDGVTDPHNVGAIMRSAVGAGASGLVLGRHRAARLTPAAVKAAAGAVEHLPVSVVTGIPATLRDLAADGVWTVGLDGGATTPLWGLQVATEPVAVVLGAEGRGLARLTRETCDLTVAIPLAGPLDSLNVAAVAALACFEVARSRA